MSVVLKRTRVAPKPGSALKQRKPLTLYNVPPEDEVSLREIEEYAFNRVQVLKAIDAAKQIGKDAESQRQMVDKAIRQYFDYEPEELLRMDVISHFVLRLAYARTEDLKRFFKDTETALLRYRITQASPAEMAEFLRYEKMEVPQLEAEEATEVGPQLRVMSQILQEHGSKAEARRDGDLLGDYFKVPFEEAQDLVKSRKVYMRGGFAYVRRKDLVSIICVRFRTNLSKMMQIAAKALPAIGEDERLLPILTNISKTYAGKDYSQEKVGGEVTPDQLDMLSKRSYPLCMKSLHGALRSKHHLKHGGRQQYGLFLKGIGVSLENSLSFWRSELTQKMPEDKFAKAYAYNIRHNYGKEGKRTNYSPMPCARIITGAAPGVLDDHGCPFKHYDAGRLANTMLASGIAHMDIRQVTDLVEREHYQLACMRYFELTHPGCASGIPINHPNQYYVESEKYWTGRQTGEISGEAALPMEVEMSAPVADDPERARLAAETMEAFADMEWDD